MITIQRGNTKLKVSKGAFDLYYKGIGFKEVGVKAEKPAAKPAETKPEIKPEAKAEGTSEGKSETKVEGKSEEIIWLRS